MFMRFKPFIGAKQFEFKDPDTGFMYKARDRPELVRHIISYRLQNKLAHIEELGQVLDNYLCSLPAHRGACVPVKKLKRGLLPTIKGGVKILKNLWNSDPAHQNVADRRAMQCRACPFNVFPDRGSFVRWSDDIAIATVGDKKSKYHEELGNCEVCTCPLKAKVFYNGRVDLSEEEIKEMETVNCWQLELQ